MTTARDTAALMRDARVRSAWLASAPAPTASPPPAKPRTRRQPKFRDCVGFTAAGRFYAIIPIALQSEANRRGHWATHEPRRKAQHQLTAAAMRGCELVPPVRVTIVRLSPRMLDEGDNLEMSAKHVRDSIAKFFGVNDGRQDLVQFDVRQAYAPEGITFVVCERIET
jgi:hypothetical protein